jgi:hypothetical protein
VPFAKSFSSDVKCAAPITLLLSPAFPTLPKGHASYLPRGIRSTEGRILRPQHGSFGGVRCGPSVRSGGQAHCSAFVSACAAPGEIGYDYIPESDRGLLDAVSAMTGANPEFLENEESRRRFCPHFAGSRPLQITSAHPTRPCHALSSLSWVMTTESPPTKK